MRHFGRWSQAPCVADNRDGWLGCLMSFHINYVYLHTIRPDGFFIPSEHERLLNEAGGWEAENAQYFKLLYFSKDDQSIVYEFRYPHPERFLKAWKAYQEATAAAWLNLGAHRRYIRLKLRNAVRLEPDLAIAWAALSAVASSKEEAIADLRRAVAADPYSKDYRQSLAQALAQKARIRRPVVGRI